jgi:hypothetical protein
MRQDVARRRGDQGGGHIGVDRTREASAVAGPLRIQCRAICASRPGDGRSAPPRGPAGGHRVAMAGVVDAVLPAAQHLQRGHEGRHVPIGRRDERCGPAHHHVPRKQRPRHAKDRWLAMCPGVAITSISPQPPAPVSPCRDLPVGGEVPRPPLRRRRAAPPCASAAITALRPQSEGPAARTGAPVASASGRARGEWSRCEWVRRIAPIRSPGASAARIAARMRRPAWGPGRSPRPRPRPGYRCSCPKRHRRGVGREHPAQARLRHHRSAPLFPSRPAPA